MELHREVGAMHNHKEAQKGHVTLNIGGYRFETSVQMLRRVPHTFFDAYFSGRYTQDVCNDGSIFVDRDGEHFGHVLEYMRDGKVSIAEPGARPSIGLLRALKRELGFYCIELAVEKLVNPAPIHGVALRLVSSLGSFMCARLTITACMLDRAWEVSRLCLRMIHRIQFALGKLRTRHPYQQDVQVTLQSQLDLVCTFWVAALALQPRAYSNMTLQKIFRTKSYPCLQRKRKLQPVPSEATSTYSEDLQLMVKMRHLYLISTRKRTSGALCRQCRLANANVLNGLIYIVGLGEIGLKYSGTLQDPARGARSQIH
jgi:hypothetical protein